MKNIRTSLFVVGLILSYNAFTHVVKADSLSFVSRTKLSDYPWGVAKRDNFNSKLHI